MGHYCIGCGESRPNEKFSGKGHKQHICKDCKREGIKVPIETKSNQYRSVQQYKKEIKTGLIIYTERVQLFVFEYNHSCYIIVDPEYLSSIYRYDKSQTVPFVMTKEFESNENFLEAVLDKYYHRLDDSDSMNLDEEEMYCEEEYQLSKKQKRLEPAIYEIQKHINDIF